MLKIAITGGIASGKSYALRYIASLNYPVISADEEIHKIYQNKNTLNQLAKIFKVSNLTKDKIKPIVLKDKSKLKILEKFLYKQLYKSFNSFEKLCRLKKSKFCFFEIPLLFEKKTHYRYAYILNIESPIFIQKARFLKRENVCVKQFYKFSNLQMHKSQKRYLNKKYGGVNLLNVNNAMCFKNQINKFILSL